MAPTEMRDYCLRCGAETQVMIAEDGAKQWVCPRGHGVVHLEPAPAAPAEPEEGEHEDEDEDHEDEDEDEDEDDKGDKPRPPKKAPARHAAKKATPHAKKK